MDIYEESLKLHKDIGGKLSVSLKHEIKDKHDLSLVYTPGVAEPCRKIHQDPQTVYDYTCKKNTVAVVTDGSAVLGLGNIGPEAALPVMEGKACLFKAYADIDAFPICLDTQNTDEIIDIVRKISPGFGGINLEDISAPRCFEIEAALQDLTIPVFHDDQHGTAIVVQAALINAAKLAGKKLNELKVVINGAGAAGKAIADMLLGIGYASRDHAVKQIIICDREGIISRNNNRKLNKAKQDLAEYTNPENINGSLSDAMKGADVFIGVSQGNLVNKEMIAIMNEKAIVLPMANPTPEIMPDEAIAGGAFIVGTGRSDFPNQVNNVLAFPGIFRGALDAKASTITPEMKLAAAFALADYIKEPAKDYIIPSALDKKVALKVAQKVKEAWLNK